jgi:hypothetical protein
LLSEKNFAKQFSKRGAGPLNDRSGENGAVEDFLQMGDSECGDGHLLKLCRAEDTCR